MFLKHYFHVAMLVSEKDIVAKHAKEVQLYAERNKHGVMLTRRLRICIHIYDLQNTVVSHGQTSPDISRILNISAVIGQVNTN